MKSNSVIYGTYVANRYTNLGTIAGQGGILFGGGGSLTNNGVVVGSVANGVRLVGGDAYVANGYGAQIIGHSSGLYSTDQTTLVNQGFVEGVVNRGVDVRASGTVANLDGGLLFGGSDGVYLATGKVNNVDGFISGEHEAGVLIGINGVVLNGAQSDIAGAAFGVAIQSGTAAVYNQGYIGAYGVTADGSGYGNGIGVGAAQATVINAAGAVIAGSRNGVVLTGIDGGSQLLNSGEVFGKSGAAVVVAGTRGDTSVYIGNRVGGLLQGHYGVLGTGAVSVVNTGKIVGSDGSGVYVNGAGSVLNLQGATISGTSDGVALFGAAGTVSNYGTIVGTILNGVELGSGVVRNIGGQIIGHGVAGVNLAAEGSIQNATVGGQGGTIYGRYAGILGAGAATITNTGGIEGRSHGIVLLGGGSVANTGGFIGGIYGDGIRLAAGGTVTNTVRAGTAGVIDGTVAGIRAGGSPARVTNAGNILAGQTGIELDAGGAVNNQVGGSISAGSAGILVTGGNATITDAGTITGGTYAIEFTGGGRDRLILQAGAVLHGKVNGAGAHTTLELASGTAALSGPGTTLVGFEQARVDGGGSWTLAGVNTLGAAGLSVAGTMTVAGSLVDTGAASLAGRLQASGTGAIRLGNTLAMQGAAVLAPGATGSVELGNAGHAAAGTVAIDAGAALRGTGTIAAAVRDEGVLKASGGTLSVTGAIAGSGIAVIDSHSALSVGGAFGAAGLTFLAGGGETARFGAPTAVTTTISGFAAGDTIDLVGFAATRLAFANDVLTLSRSGGTAAHLAFSGAYTGHHFAFAADGHGGTNISII